MITPEGAVKKRVKALLAFHNCHQHWPVSNGMGAPTLDCVGCHRGRYFAVETKAPGKHPTPRQEVTMKVMREAGAAVFVTDGDEASMAAIRYWLVTA